MQFPAPVSRPLSGWLGGKRQVASSPLYSPLKGRWLHQGLPNVPPWPEYLLSDCSVPSLLPGIAAAFLPEGIYISLIHL